MNSRQRRRQRRLGRLRPAQSAVQPQPQCLFRGENVIRAENGNFKLESDIRFDELSRLVLAVPKFSVYADKHVGLLPVFGGFGSAVKWDTVDAAMHISMPVQFNSSMTFAATIFGKSVA